MNASLSAPGTTSEVRARTALVVAPHPDDEVLGCGGLVARLVAADAAVRVLFLADGGGEERGEERDAYVERRREEAREAAAVLGLAGIDRLGLPDGALDQHLEPIARGVRRALLSFRPELLLVTSPLESSADHRAAFRAVHELLAGVREGDALWPVTRELEILAYEVNRPLYPDLLIDVDDQVEVLERAMACYASQQERHDYLGARLGLLRFRALTLPAGVGHAEAYRRLGLGDFTTHSPAALVAALGGANELLRVDEGPRISVVVRTRDRPQLLAEALASLTAGSYRRAEAVIVNDGGEPPRVPDDFPLPHQIVEHPRPLGRAAAANAGLRAATGEYVAFLDDDDIAFPEHLATLAGLAAAADTRVAYTDAAVGTYELGEEGWSCTERRLPYSRDFDPHLLLVDNYIPFNTVIVERALLDEIGPLDTELEFFEDWDFLIRLAERVPFRHLARVTCEYRQFRGAGHHVLGDRPRERADFLAMKARVIAKHRRRLSDEALARVVDRLRGETVEQGERALRLRDELDACETRYHDLNGRLTSREIHLRSVEESLRLARRELSDLRRIESEQLAALREQGRALADKDRVLEERAQALDEKNRILEERGAALDEQGKALRGTYAEIERLNALIRAMESSRAWRLHQRLQRWRA